MTIVEKSKILDGLAKDGKFSVTSGKTTVSIEARDGRHEILVSEPGMEPRQWLYRSSKVAVDRFEEQVLHYRNRRNKR